MSTRKARLLAAERATGARRVGGVLTLQPGESAEDAVARAAASGRTGPYLVVPAAMDAATWEAAAILQQRALMVETAAHIQGLPVRQPSPMKTLRS